VSEVKTTQDPIDELVSEIVEIVERGDVAIVVIDKRTSEAQYNYKTRSIVIVWKYIEVDWGEQLIRDVKVVRITAGIYQSFPLNIESIIEHEVKRRDSENKYMIVVVNL
jgi:hypothetical protein